MKIMKHYYGTRKWLLIITAFMLAAGAVLFAAPAEGKAAETLGTISAQNPKIVKQVDAEAGNTYEFAFQTDASEKNYTLQFLKIAENNAVSFKLELRKENAASPDAEKIVTSETNVYSMGRELGTSSLYILKIYDVDCDDTAHIVLNICSENLGGSKEDYVAWYNKLLSGIKINPASVSIIKGNTYQIKTKAVGSVDTKKGFKWSSSNNAVATVSSKGLVTGKKNGKAVITCSLKSDKSIFATCEIIVTEKAKSISLNKKSLSLHERESFQLKANIKPKAASFQNVIWKSSNKNVAEVTSDGKVTAISEGTATITATPAKAENKGEKVKATCKITVKKGNNIADISISEGAPGTNILAEYLYGGAGVELYYTLRVGNYSGELDLDVKAGNYSEKRTVTVKKNTVYKMVITLGYTGYSDKIIYNPNNPFGGTTTIPATSSTNKISIMLPGGGKVEHNFTSKGTLNMLAVTENPLTLAE